MSESPLYVRIADNVTQQVAGGIAAGGSRAVVASGEPAARREHVHGAAGVSVAGNRGYLESRPQSGFFVRAPFATSSPSRVRDKDDAADGGLGATRSSTRS